MNKKIALVSQDLPRVPRRASSMRTATGLALASALASALGLILLVPGLASAQTTVNPMDLWKLQPKMDRDYQEMNTRLMQVHVVKSLPFFQMTVNERMARVSTYASDLRAGQVGKVGSALKNDFAKGGLLTDVAVAAGTSVLTQVSSGATMDEAVNRTFDYMATPEFFAGQLMGGTLGAAMGAMIPMPVMAGLTGQIMGGFPLMAGAMLGGTLGYSIISQLRNEGSVDLLRTLRSVDFLNLTLQALGATIGTTLGAYLPLGPVGPIVAGVICSQFGLKVATWIRSKIYASDTAETHDPTTQGDGGATGTAAGGTVTTAVDPLPADALMADELASWDAARLQALRDTAYARYLEAERSGDHETAMACLRSYTEATRALETRRLAAAQ